MSSEGTVGFQWKARRLNEHTIEVVFLVGVAQERGAKMSQCGSLRLRPIEWQALQVLLDSKVKAHDEEYQKSFKEGEANEDDVDDPDPAVGSDRGE